MNQDQLKQAVAEAALEEILSDLHADTIVGIGTGSTASKFIDVLAAHKDRFRGAVASSEVSAEQLKKVGIEVFDLNSVTEIDVYVDGADEADKKLHLIKGGGAALTREKIVAAVAKKFICIADASKDVDVLGAFPLPVEVIPMARSYVSRKIVELGGNPVWREGVVTDNGNQIIDIHGLEITDPAAFETTLNNIVGVVTNGLFANRPADVLMLATEDGVRTFSVMNTMTKDGNYF